MNLGGGQRSVPNEPQAFPAAKGRPTWLCHGPCSCVAPPLLSQIGSGAGHLLTESRGVWLWGGTLESTWPP